MKARIPTLLLAVAVAFAAASVAAAPVASRRGVVASASEAASRAGVEMLRRGGNAFDAAAATAFVLSVVEPYHSGLGGGGFAVAWDASAKHLVALDFREVAPAAARPDMFLGDDGEPRPALSRDGGLSVAVPGAALGYLELQRRFGRLSRAAVLAPAVRAAEEGFAVTPRYQRFAESRRDCLARSADAARIFLRRSESGAAFEAPPLGARIVQRELAATLRRLAREGAAGFYRGAVARAIVATVRGDGGVLGPEDLARYRVRDRAPLVGSYRGRRVATAPPPSAGGVAVLEMLNVLEQAPLRPWHDPAQLHLFIEASKQSFADRNRWLGDPDFARAPVEALVAKPYARQLFERFEGKPARPAEKVEPFRESDHTTHLSVIDADGNAVALTTTINYRFGSCVVARGTGVLLNDEMDDFAAKPGAPNAYGLVTGPANAIAPGKTPLSSMAPTLVFVANDADRVALAVGSPGGPTIPTTVAQVIVAALDYELPLDRALAAPRVHHQYLPDVVNAEPAGLDAATLAALRAMGHTVEVMAPWGDAQAVAVDPSTGVRYGASDLRGEGRAAGE